MTHPHPTIDTGPHWTVDEDDEQPPLIWDGNYEVSERWLKELPDEAYDALVRAVRDAARVPDLERALARWTEVGQVYAAIDKETDAEYVACLWGELCDLLDLLMGETDGN